MKGIYLKKNNIKPGHGLICSLLRVFLMGLGVCFSEILWISSTYPQPLFNYYLFLLIIPACFLNLSVRVVIFFSIFQPTIFFRINSGISGKKSLISGIFPELYKINKKHNKSDI